MRWVDEIVRAFETLGGVARYSDLYEYIVRTTDRSLTEKWRATVRRTIEDHSSDSLNFRGSDLFKKVGHGHWALRGETVSEVELVRRDALSASEVVRDVFVREHWRSRPQESESDDVSIELDLLEPTSVSIGDCYLRVGLTSGVELVTPLWWYPRLLQATEDQLKKVELMMSGILWPDIDENLSIEGMLKGRRAENAVPPAQAAE